MNVSARPTALYTSFTAVLLALMNFCGAQAEHVAGGG